MSENPIPILDLTDDPQPSDRSQPGRITPIPKQRKHDGSLSADDLIIAIRSMPFGGLDDTARNLEMSPQIRSTVSPVVTSFRWAAVMYGMIFGAAEAFKGSYAVVATLSVCLFLTCWRTMIPVKLGSISLLDRVAAIVDTLILGVAVGYSGGPTSPFVFCVMAAIAVAAFGWGYGAGGSAFVVGWVSMAVGAALLWDGRALQFDRTLGLLVGSMALIALGSSYLRARLLLAEQRRRDLAGKVDTLSEANDLLTMLNSVARTLPTSLNQREALDAAREQLLTTFKGNVICLMEFDETHDEWIPKLTEGCVVRPTSTVDDLPVHLRQAMDASRPWLVSDLSAGSLPGISSGSGSGLYTKLVARGRTVGVLGIEHPVPGHFSAREGRLLFGMADVVALTLDNARWFGRLRSLGAEEERVRIARDLHDRLGQWLTYISFELERFISTEGSGFIALTELYADVQTALDELRETLRQLRSEISEGRPLGLVGRELAERFSERTAIDVEFVATNPAENMPIPVENELLRILQEALNNVDKHAKAEQVTVVWSVHDGACSLAVTDDGTGFEADKGVRDTAYGLVGMRERADVIGGRLTVRSAPDAGTTITVTVGSTAVTRET